AIISLQALACALGEIDDLPATERAAGLDLASVQIRALASQLNQAWHGEPMPQGVIDLMDDAKAALQAARDGGVEFTVVQGPLIAEHPAELAANLLAAGFAGDLYLAAPGVPVFPTCPAGFVRVTQGGAPSADIIAEIATFLGKREVKYKGAPRFRQAYRQFDFSKGGPVRDVVIINDEGLPAGQPLLVPVILAGQLQPVPLPIPAARNQPALPVEFE
ncbi:MAG TPA: hypothetical protein VK157_05270, partial [Phycisphaerales bacterium]|nr:hypothetical protein [Phycisphaerales bacterium]